MICAFARKLNETFTSFHDKGRKWHLCQMHVRCVEWRMSGLQQAFPESFDDILAAVQESPRGRWFLEGMEARLKKADTSRILEAITKLEAHVQAHSGSGADAALVSRARAAIANARREIATIPDKPASLSAEGQMFARLASLSKEAFSAQPGLGQGVQRALTLVAELDREFSGSQPSIPQQNNSPDLFKQDEAVFEPAPQVKAAAPAKLAPAPDNPARGAKLVITRVGVAPEQTPPVPAVEAPAPAASPAAEQRHEPPVFDQSSARVEHSEVPQSRIVIIRRKAEDMESVPLLGTDDPDTASSAA